MVQSYSSVLICQDEIQIVSQTLEFARYIVLIYYALCGLNVFCVPWGQGGGLRGNTGTSVEFVRALGSQSW